MWHWINVYLWQNYSVGNFTASAVVFLGGGRYVWKKHISKHIKLTQQLHQHHLGHLYDPNGDPK